MSLRGVERAKRERRDEATPNGWSPDRVTITLLSRRNYNYRFFRLVMRLPRRLSPPRKDKKGKAGSLNQKENGGNETEIIFSVPSPPLICRQLNEILVIQIAI
ncbi:hypothetical protein KAI52_01610 [Candidatus Parcubacteria bacterium]|nr:hypothetical protein [Candidatus Parcubacteria bacterium]